MKRLSASSYSLIVVIAFMLVVIGLSLRLEYFAEKLLPLVISISVLVLAAIELRKEISGNGHARTAVTGGKTGGGEETGMRRRRYLSIGAWLLGFYLAIYLLGFIIAILLFVGSYMKQHGSKWSTAIIWAVLWPAIIYSVFQVTLGVDLYPGLLLAWLGL